MIDPVTLKNIVYAHDGDSADLPFWAGCERGEFLTMRCGTCGRRQWPAGHCPEHGARDMAWVPASGKGTVHVHTVMRRGRCDATGTAAPYIVAVIALDEGAFFHSTIVGIAPEQVVHGLPVDVEFVVHANGMTVPVFRPTADGPA